MLRDNPLLKSNEVIEEVPDINVTTIEYFEQAGFHSAHFSVSSPYYTTELTLFKNQLKQSGARIVSQFTRQVPASGVRITAYDPSFDTLSKAIVTFDELTTFRAALKKNGCVILVEVLV